jgi:phospholipid/cholesterol/gamma-HCH transport system substrate-binding protein
MGDRTGRPFLGLLYLLGVVALIGASIGVYAKEMPWQDAAEVSVRTRQVGLGLSPHSDVKYQGMRVGEVRRIAREGDTSTVTMAIDPELIGSIPADVDAMFAPKTFFGDKFVDLRQRKPGIGSGSPGRTLAHGDTVVQSGRAVEIGEIFDRLVPVLRTLQPERVAAVLSSLADLLDGRGDDIARTMNVARDALEALEPSYDDLIADLGKLAAVSDVYADAAPDLLSALDDAASISQENLVEHRDDLHDALRDATRTSKSTRAVIAENREGLRVLTSRSRPVLALVDYYSPTIPCILAALDYGNRVANLAAGVRGPYIALSVDMVVDQAPYVYPNDLPSNPDSEAYVTNLPAQVPSFDRHCPVLPKRVTELPKTPPPYSQLPYGQTFNLESP